MTDIPPKSPTMAPVGMMAVTGLASSTIGDQVGDALAKIMAWVIAVHCQCVPPEDVISGLHTICVAIVVAIAFYIHYRFARTSN